MVVFVCDKTQLYFNLKNLKIDKVTVWDSGNGNDGKTSTANFMSGLLKTIPPLDDLFKSAGMNLPSFLKGADTQESLNNNEDFEASQEYLEEEFEDIE